MNKTLHQIFYFFFCLSSSSVLFGQSSWSFAGNGLWNVAGNWSPATVPNSDIAEVEFLPLGATSITITIAPLGGLTINSMSFSSGTTSYTIGVPSDQFSFVSTGSGTPPAMGINTGTHSIVSDMVIPVVFEGLLLIGSPGTTLTISGVISESASGAWMNISTSGTIVLNPAGGGPSTYSGGIDFDGGTLQVWSDGALGAALGGSSGAVNLAGTFQAGGSFTTSTMRSFLITGVSAFDTYGGNTLTIAGPISGSGSPLTITDSLGDPGILSLAGGTSGFSGATMIVSPATLNVDLTAVVTSTTLSGAISGNGSLTVTGGGGGGGRYLVLGGNNNSFSGTTTITTSTVTINAANAMVGGPVSMSNSVLASNVSFSSTNAFTLNAVETFYPTGSMTLSGIIGGAGSLNAVSGTVILTGVNNTYSGGSSVADTGILQVSLDGSLGVSMGLYPTVTLNGGTFQAGGSFSTNALRQFNITDPAIFDSQGYVLTIGGVINGTGPLTKIGSGTLILSGANGYSGGTTVNVGTLQGTTSSLQGVIVTSSGTSVIFNQTTNGSYGGGISGSGSLVKLGSGTVTLTGANSHTGGTTISAGILSVASDSYLGNASGSLTFVSGTLQITSGITIARNITLNGSGVIDTQSNTDTLSGSITGIGSLTKESAGTLILTGSNNYQGGSVVNGGILQGNITSLPGNISLNNGANVTFNQGVLGTFIGLITGSGSLTKTGVGTLILGGVSNYSGGTTISAGTLQGTTTTLPGGINIGAGSTLAFSQSSSGIYSGSITGPAGSFFNIEGGGVVTITGNSSGFLGLTALSGNSELIANGNLANSSVQINGGSLLRGSGTVGSVANAGQIIPGDESVGTLSINGTLSFSSGGALVTQLTPSTNNLLSVSGTATLTNGTSIINMGNGFYGVGGVRTILTAGSVVGPFAVFQLDPHLDGHLVYNPTNVQLVYFVLDPFLNFPFANANEKAVGNNLDAIILAGDASLDLHSVIDSMVTLSVVEINDALDQMHPAALSAFAELQTELGGQLLSLFHRKPSLACFCSNASRLWIEPFGNWLEEKKQGMEIGFNATTRGVAFGYDHQFWGCWTLGVGGAYNATDLKWSLKRGYAHMRGAYGSLYSDLFLGNFFIGLSAYAGKDWFDTARQIHFSSIDRQAKSTSDGLDAGGQLTTAYFFGTPSCLLYPYATADFLYLENSSFKEHGADSLDLDVRSYCSSTLRAEAGAALRFMDRNRDGTICISPLISAGYVLELPLHRDHYRAMFSGQTIAFTTQGWDMAWQLLNLRFGLAITYRCFSLDSDYAVDISPEGDSPFFNQRAEFKMSCNF